MLMKLASLAFLLVLVFIHLESSQEELLAEPMSVFRDGDVSGLGYLLFVLLLLICGLQAVAMHRANRRAEAGFTLFATSLLLVSMTTETGQLVHEGPSFLLLFLLYAYYGCLLLLAESFWLLPHLLLPLWLIGLTGFHSFGLWEKCAIVYFVLACNVQFHWLNQEAAGQPAKPRRRGFTPRRRKVFLVEPGQAWRRG